MVRSLFLVVWFSCCPSFASQMSPETPAYQEGVLLGFRDVETPVSCSGGPNAVLTDEAVTQGATPDISHCSHLTLRRYNVQVGESFLAIERPTKEHDTLRGRGSVEKDLTLLSGNVLGSKRPGTHVLLRQDGSDVYVKLGKKDEVKYHVAPAY